jgi:GntR family transcriptional regulator, transcriptional repressor for pyruvate dehydrogenase complex
MLKQVRQSGPSNHRSDEPLPLTMDDTGSKPLAARLMAFIAERRLQSGDRLPSERELAERFGIGRNAVREAIATLTALGVVESRPQSGIYLREIRRQSSFEALVMRSRLGRAPTLSEISETMEVRAVLERIAVELACARRDDEDLATLDRILKETERVIDEKGNIADAYKTFRLALVSAAHNAILLRVLNASYEFTQARRRLYFAHLQRAKTSHRQHKAIVEAVRARDAPRATKLIDDHMANVQSYLQLDLSVRSRRDSAKQCNDRQEMVNSATQSLPEPGLCEPA